MICNECENRKYCVSFVKEPKMYGCTNGEPDCLPKNVAHDIVIRLRINSVALGISLDDYFTEVMQQVNLQMKGSNE